MVEINLSMVKLDWKIKLYAITIWNQKKTILIKDYNWWKLILS